MKKEHSSVNTFWCEAASYGGMDFDYLVMLEPQGHCIAVGSIATMRYRIGSQVQEWVGTVQSVHTYQGGASLRLVALPGTSLETVPYIEEARVSFAEKEIESDQYRTATIVDQAGADDR